ncbi:hypothetical protein AWB77_04285 [Caballeronia fortuita]|uniref:Uncharacterized protein n=1 Tax=Caballeronia fortuita TaxID=1777138 RepID=A0A158CP87_9BURK|nr:hypothetical protein [Caballeronia fortuita]SAK83437.1 hypothetical protein AWB77_04285 [Caballeronia fortuita]
MSQPRGRYAGSRDSGQRQPRHVSQSSSNRQRQTYAKAPARESAQTASIFKTRSFQFLVDAVGAENIALGLDSSMTRVAELLKGERFTPETAFHMETTLGLPHGFFDQPHPLLTPETIARLKSPLDFVETDEKLDAESETHEPATALDVGHQPSLEVRSSEDAEMPKKPAGSSPSASRNNERGMAKQPSRDASLKGAPSTSKASQKSTQQHALPLKDAADVESIRRANLHVLTTRNGSKVRLGIVMALSGSNMAHRLHSKKRMDDVEASRFTERLGLPVGWLDTPRSEVEIPESVSRLLTPAARGRASVHHESVQHDEPPVLATQNRVRSKRAAVEARPGGPHLDGLGDAQSLTSADVQRGEETIGAGPLDQVSAALGELAGHSLNESEQHVPFASPVAPVTIVPPPASVRPERKAASLPSPSVTSLDNLHGIEPIAEALIKTLAGKARAGRLDELKALELLQQAILL